MRVNTSFMQIAITSLLPFLLLAYIWLPLQSVQVVFHWPQSFTTFVLSSWHININIQASSLDFNVASVSYNVTAHMAHSQSVSFSLFFSYSPTSTLWVIYICFADFFFSDHALQVFYIIIAILHKCVCERVSKHNYSAAKCACVCMWECVTVCGRVYLVCLFVLRIASLVCAFL